MTPTIRWPRREGGGAGAAPEGGRAPSVRAHRQRRSAQVARLCAASSMTEGYGVSILQAADSMNSIAETAGEVPRSTASASAQPHGAIVDVPCSTALRLRNMPDWRGANSPSKVTWPGRKQVWRRRYGTDGRMASDLIARGDKGDGEPLIQLVMRAAAAPSRRSPTSGRARRAISKRLPEDLRRLKPGASYPVEVARLAGASRCRVERPRSPGRRAV